MRTFTKQEKWILRKAYAIKTSNTHHSISLSDICLVFLDKEFIKISYSKSVDFYFIEFRFDGKSYKVGDEAISKKQKEIEDNILNTIFLLKYLKENNLLFEFTEENTVTDFNIVKSKYETKNHLTFQSNFDKATRKLIIDNLSSKRYFIRQEFVDFVDNDFRTIDEHRFRKNQIATWVGITIALLIGIISIFLTVLSNKSTLKIDDKQFKQIDSQIDLLIKNQHKSITIDSVFLHSANDSCFIMRKKIENKKIK